MTQKANAPLANSLRALTDKLVEGIKRNESFRVNPALLEFEEGFNLRQDTKETKEHIERLYLAMKAGAQMPPLDVQVAEGKILVRDGHCRTKAGQRYQKEEKDFTLECRQLRGNDTDAVLHMLGSGTGGKALTPLEAGLGYLRLLTAGLKPQEIATRLGVSVVTVNNGVTLAEAPREVQQMILDGKVSSTLVRDAIKNGKEGIADLKQKVKEAEEEEAREASNPTKSKKKKSKKTKQAKVTAKKLKGTKAEKKTKKRKTKETGINGPDGVNGPEPVDPDSIVVTIPRDVATESAKRIRDAATACPELKQLAAILDTALI